MDQVRTNEILRKRGLYGKLKHAIAEAVSPTFRQRWKAFMRLPGYSPILSIPTLSFNQKIGLIRRCFKIDWNILLGHRPGEIAFIFKEMAKTKATKGEVMVEAGCWNGGSSAKFSLMCKVLGYELHVYDSFQGVESHTEDDNYDHWYDYSGEYSASEALVRENIKQYGEIEICKFYAGWFKDSMAVGNLKQPVRFVYIDCDLSKGTMEALEGVNPVLTQKAIIFSQDYHIPPVREMLNKEETWKAIGRSKPQIEFGHHHTAAFYM